MKSSIYAFILLILLVASEVWATEKIVYSHLTDGYWQIWMMDSDGTNQSQVTTSKRDKRDPACAGSTDDIMYRTNSGQMFKFNRQSGEEVELLKKFNNINNPTYCAQTQQVLFVRFDPREIDISDIWLSDREGKDVKMVTQSKRLKYQPKFSSDCQKIVYVHSDEPLSHNIWMMSADGSNNVQITNAAGLDVHPNFTPDGKSIVFTSNREGKDYEIYRVDIDSKTVKALTNNENLDTSPAVSDKSNQMVFVSSRGGNQQIWSMNTAGDEVKQLTQGKAEAVEPNWCTEQE